MKRTIIDEATKRAESKEAHPGELENIVIELAKRLKEALKLVRNSPRLFDANPQNPNIEKYFELADKLEAPLEGK